MSGNNCYNCGYRGELPSNAHSRCKFDWAKSDLSEPQGKAWGIQHGWWHFPVNFDPVWMLGECEAHSENVEPDMVIEKQDPLLELIGILGGVGRL